MIPVNSEGRHYRGVLETVTRREYIDLDPSAVIKSSMQIELSPDIFAEGSLGRAIFPDILSGRKRAETTFEQPFKDLLVPLGRIDLMIIDERRAVWDILSERTVREVLNMAEEEFSSLPASNKLRQGLQKYLESLAVTPHARILKKAFTGRTIERPQAPVPPEREAELVDAVEAQIATLHPLEQEVLAAEFGFRDGVTRSLFDLFPTAPHGVAFDILHGALYRLASSDELKGYLALPENSVARQVLGAVFIKELPDFGPIEEDGNGYVVLWGLSESTINELIEFSKDLAIRFRREREVGLKYFLTEDLSGRLSTKVCQDIQKELARLQEASKRLARQARLERILRDIKGVSDSMELDYPLLLRKRDEPGGGEVYLSVRREQDEKQTGLMEELIAHAREEWGLTSASEIHEWLIDEGQFTSFFGLPADSWIIRIVIERMLEDEKADRNQE